MEDFKLIYAKFDDEKALVGNLKTIMKSYEMQLIKVDGGKYLFDRDGGYTREFIINKANNGWAVIQDEDDVQAESMCQELSELCHCFIIAIGIYNEDLLFYTAFNNGVQVDQYMSTMEYYEYQVDEDVVNSYRGNAEAFAHVIGDENKGLLQNILDGCRDEEIEPEDAYFQILKLFSLRETEENEETDQEDMAPQDEEEIIEIGDIFYVDFNSINIKVDDVQKVIDTVRRIADESGYKEVENFESVSEGKSGFFKKIFNSVIENRRIRFYISPLSEGWVTLVGEVEVLYGGEPTQWDFLHIEDRLSEILQNEVINIYGDSEHWGFRIFKNGSLIYNYTSVEEFTGTEDIPEILGGIDKEFLHNILNSDVNNPEEIDSKMQEFCSALSIRNYKINIPMDYTDEEYKARVLDKLPDGHEFTRLLYILKK